MSGMSGVLHKPGMFYAEAACAAFTRVRAQQRREPSERVESVLVLVH